MSERMSKELRDAAAPALIEIPGEFAPALLQWYGENARVLPWRDDPQPYKVWVSEIMLQQTRVEAVKPYFQRFMEVLPNLESLAQAEEQILLKLWEGLGYYNRARNLQKAAQQALSEYGGLPSTAEELIRLPGIGPYTAGAVASIAFGRPVPAVDGNRAESGRKTDGLRWGYFKRFSQKRSGRGAGFFGGSRSGCI